MTRAYAPFNLGGTMGKIIIIAGPTAVGKDSAMNELMKMRPEIKPLISYTTRPIRPGEVDGVQYNFINEEQYALLGRTDLILSARTYYTIQNGEEAVWHYGAPFPSTKADYVTIVDHQGAKNIIKKIGKENVLLIYLDAADETLETRCRMRGDEKAEYKRRLVDDRIQFLNIQEIHDFGLRSDDYTAFEVAERISIFLDNRNL